MYAYFRQAFGPVDGGDDDPPICEWRIRRNCSLTPRQSLGATVLLIVLMLAIGVASATFFGVWLAMPFAMLYTVAIGVAFIAYTRHATDGETLRLAPPFVVVEIDDGGRHTVHRMNAARLTVFTDQYEGTAVYLCDGWQRVRVGRQLPIDARPEFVRQLRRFVTAGR
jgi:uncharacterized membrane protein